jgi:hypothetical protein
MPMWKFVDGGILILRGKGDANVILFGVQVFSIFSRHCAFQRKYSQHSIGNMSRILHLCV